MTVSPPPPAPGAAAPPAGDDDATDLPALDGEAGETGADLFGDGPLADDDDPVGLDDEIAAEEAAEAWIEPLADVESEGWETGEDEPVEADPELGADEAERWTEATDEESAAPIEVELDPLGPEGRDEGDEGLDDERLQELELPPAPAPSGRGEDEAYAEDLDLGVTLPERGGDDEPPGTGEVE